MSAAKPESSWADPGGRAIDWALENEWILLLLVFPAVVLPSAATAPLLLLLALPWALRWLRKRRLIALTPLNLPLLLLSLLLLINLCLTAALEFDPGKAVGLLFGIAVFFAAAEASSAGSRSWIAAYRFFLLCGLGVGLLALIGTGWREKLPLISSLLAGLPTIGGRLPGAAAGIHPNQLGGILLLFVPPALVYALAKPRERARRHSLLAGSAAVLLFGLLLLTQSRSAYLGLGAGMLIVGLLWSRPSPALRLSLLLVLLLLALVLAWSVQRLVGDLQSLTGYTEHDRRLEIWSRALQGIGDYAFTGVGLGVFRHALPDLYPVFDLNRAEDIAHVHNIYLQTALDLGLPGLVAYLAILGSTLAALVQTGQRLAEPSLMDGLPRSRLAAGLAGGLLGYAVFGLTDAVALGARPGFLFWLACGLATGLSRLCRGGAT